MPVVANVPTALEVFGHTCITGFARLALPLLPFHSFQVGYSHDRLTTSLGPTWQHGHFSNAC